MKDKWDIQAAKDALMMKQGKVPNPYHWPTEMLTLEEIVERYGYALTEEQIEILRNYGKETTTE